MLFEIPILQTLRSRLKKIHTGSFGVLTENFVIIILKSSQLIFWLLALAIRVATGLISHPQKSIEVAPNFKGSSSASAEYIRDFSGALYCFYSDSRAFVVMKAGNLSWICVYPVHFLLALNISIPKRVYRDTFKIKIMN